MKSAIRLAFTREMAAARQAYKSKDYDTAFHYLERAHILGQRYFITHMLTHWFMLKIAIQCIDGREIRGQIFRSIAVIPGYLTGLVPKGNTGRANVSAFKPMPVPEDLAELLEDFKIWKEVLLRVIFWLSIACLIWAGKAIWRMWVEPDEGSMAAISINDAESSQPHYD